MMDVLEAGQPKLNVVAIMPKRIGKHAGAHRANRGIANWEWLVERNVPDYQALIPWCTIQLTRVRGCINWSQWDSKTILCRCVFVDYGNAHSVKVDSRRNPLVHFNLVPGCAHTWGP